MLGKLFDLFRRRLPQSLDAQIIRQLKDVGSNLRQPHGVDFFFYFLEQDRAERVAARLEADGFLTDIHQSPEMMWGLVVHKNLLITEDSMQELRDKFVALAESEGGMFDGWGAETV